jgi:hypothetical protein
MIAKRHVGKPETRRPVGRQRCRWKGNIILSIRKTGQGGVDYINLAQNRDQ